MAVRINEDLSAAELRALAQRETNGRVASRLLALAGALSGMNRTQAAEAAGMDRQTLRDWVWRYNAEGVAGLRDRPKGHPPEALTEAEQASLANIIFRGPDPKKDGVSTWTLAELSRWIEARFGKHVHPASLSRILRRNGFSRQKARSTHPQSDPGRQARFKKRGSPRP